MADNLTVAFIAMGIRSALIKTKSSLPKDMGEVELVDAIISHARDLDDAFEEVACAFDGVFVYDIAEPFGEQAANCLLEGRTLDYTTLIEELFHGKA